MTDDLRAIDRKAAELMGAESDEVVFNKNGRYWTFRPSTDPAAANLLIEDLRRRGVDYQIRISGDREQPYVEIDDYAKVLVSGQTWTEAVTRFYIAVRRAEG